jgi:hypothetical protein
MSANATNAFSTFNFGDPFLNQFVGSNSEFHGEDPPGYVAQMLQTGSDRFVPVDSGTGTLVASGGPNGLLPASTSSDDKCAWWVQNAPLLAPVLGCNPDGSYNGPGGSSPSGASTPAAGYNSVSGQTAPGFESPQKIVNNAIIGICAVVLIGLGAWKVLS